MSARGKSWLLALLAVTALLGCSKSGKQPAAAPAGVSVADIEIGRSVGADKTIADKTDSFGSGDTIYVSVKTVGSAPSATLTARWTYQDGQVVDDSSQTISPSASAVSEFHVAKPDGWPSGSYQVEVLLNGTSAGTKKFKVG